MNDRSTIREVFLEEFELLLDTIESELKGASDHQLPHALEVITERQGTLDGLGYLRSGYLMGVLDALQRLDVGEELIDRVLERARGLPN